MNNESSQFNLVSPSKKLAITSLILGIVSLPTMGLLFIGGIVGLILGIQARRKAKSTPEQYGGKGIALAGIITSVLSLVIAVPILIAAIAIPNLLKSQQVARETGAIGVIKTIGTAQLKYSATKGRGKFADLETLASEGLIDYQLGITHGASGYSFECKPINAGVGRAALFDVSAKPETSGTFGTGNRSFYTNETFVIYWAEGREPPTATPQNRVPHNGTPIR
jgi:competence protein ComGC